MSHAGGKAGSLSTGVRSKSGAASAALSAVLAWDGNPAACLITFISSCLPTDLHHPDNADMSH